MIPFFSMGGDPSAEREAFDEAFAARKSNVIVLKPKAEKAASVLGHSHRTKIVGQVSAILSTGEMGTVIGRSEGKFVVKIGDDRREVHPTEIERFV